MKFLYEIEQNKRISVGYIEANSIREAKERVRSDLKNGILLFLQTQNGKVVFEKKVKNEI